MITIVGSGAIGGTIGASLAMAGHEVEFVDVDTGHVAAINQNGLRLLGEREGLIATRAYTPATHDHPVSTAIIAVKGQHTLAAANLLSSKLTSDGVVLVAQNGLGSFQAAEVLGAHRTLAALVNIAADCTGPGEVTFYGFGSLVLGAVDAAAEPCVAEFLEPLKAVGDVRTTPNIRGLLWNKLGFGVILAMTALDHEPLLDTMAAHTRLVQAIGTEAFDVARAGGVEIPSHDHLDPAVFAAGVSHNVAAREIRQWIEYQRPHQKPRTGIYRDLAVRKRKTEVSAHFSDVRSVADRYDLQTPLMDHIGQMVSEIEDGKREIGYHNIVELEGLLR